MKDLVLPAITLVIGLPIAMWASSPRRAARRAADRWQRAAEETFVLMWPVLQGHPARLLPGPASVDVRVPAALEGGRVCVSGAGVRWVDTSEAHTPGTPGQLATPLGQLLVVGAGDRDDAPTTPEQARGVAAGDGRAPCRLEVEAGTPANGPASTFPRAAS